MLKFKMDGEGGKVMIGLGLTRENIDRLVAGEPVLAKLEQIDMPKVEVAIFFGESLPDLLKELAPWVGPDTKMRDEG